MQKFKRTNNKLSYIRERVGKVQWVDIYYTCVKEVGVLAGYVIEMIILFFYFWISKQSSLGVVLKS